MLLGIISEYAHANLSSDWGDFFFFFMVISNVLKLLPGAMKEYLLLRIKFIRADSIYNRNILTMTTGRPNRCLNIRLKVDRLTNNKIENNCLIRFPGSTQNFLSIVYDNCGFKCGAASAICSWYNPHHLTVFEACCCRGASNATTQAGLEPL